jgi:hypothetical protein
VLRARKDDQVSAFELGGFSSPDEIGDLFERSELVKVRRRRIADDCDAMVVTGCRAGVGCAVLVWKAVIDKGYDSEQRDARHLLEQRRRWVEKREIPAELVQDEAADSSLRFLADQRPRPVEMGEGAAAVDVGDDDDGSVRELRDSQIGDVDLAKVDLGGTAKRSGLSMSPLSAGTTATSSVLKPARLRGKLGCRVATMTGTVAMWRKCDTFRTPLPGVAKHEDL